MILSIPSAYALVIVVGIPTIQLLIGIVSALSAVAYMCAADAKMSCRAQPETYSTRLGLVYTSVSGTIDWDYLMPGLGPGRPPPKLCPICRERLWFEDRIGLPAAWQYYNVHMHNVHSEFERWNRRMSWNYGIGILFLIGALITTGILRNTPITPLLLGLFIIVSAIVYLIQRRGRKIQNVVE